MWMGVGSPHRGAGMRKGLSAGKIRSARCVPGWHRAHRRRLCKRREQSARGRMGRSEAGGVPDEFALTPCVGGAGVKYDRDGFNFSSTLSAGCARASTGGRQANASLALHCILHTQDTKALARSGLVQAPCSCSVWHSACGCARSNETRARRRE